MNINVLSSKFLWLTRWWWWHSIKFVSSRGGRSSEGIWAASWVAVFWATRRLVMSGSYFFRGCGHCFLGLQSLCFGLGFRRDRGFPLHLQHHLHEKLKWSSLPLTHALLRFLMLQTKWALSSVFYHCQNTGSTVKQGPGRQLSLAQTRWHLKFVNNYQHIISQSLFQVSKRKKVLRGLCLSQVLRGWKSWQGRGKKSQPAAALWW